jgi:hypothetical protein
MKRLCFAFLLLILFHSQHAAAQWEAMYLVLPLLVLPSETGLEARIDSGKVVDYRVPLAMPLQVPMQQKPDDAPAGAPAFKYEHRFVITPAFVFGGDEVKDGMGAPFFRLRGGYRYVPGGNWFAVGAGVALDAEAFAALSTELGLRWLSDNKDGKLLSDFNLNSFVRVEQPFSELDAPRVSLNVGWSLY